MVDIFPLQFLLATCAGWVNRRQLDVIEYLRAENQGLKAQVGRRRLRLTDDQRRRLRERKNHQGIGNELIDGVSSGQTGGVVGCRQRLGGFLRYYYRAA